MKQQAVSGKDYVNAYLSMLLFATNTIFVQFAYNMYQKAGLRIAQLSSTIVLLIQFLKTSRKDPGIIPGFQYTKQTDEEPRWRDVGQYTLTSELQPLSPICRTCHVYKPPTTSHCLDCGHCVCYFDHHCTWLGIDIGARNYFDFLLTVLLILVFCCTNTIFLATSFANTDKSFRNIWYIPKFVTTLFYGVFSLYGIIRTIRLLLQHSKQLAQDTTTKDMILNRITAGCQLQKLLHINPDNLFDNIFKDNTQLHELYKLQMKSKKQYNGFSRVLLGWKMPVIRHLSTTQAERLAWQWTILLSGVFKE